MSLKGKKIVITRPKEQAGELARLISNLGGIPLIVSTVEIKSLKNLKPFRKFFESVVMGQVDITIFMSQNGVTSLFKASERLGIKERLNKALNAIEIVAIGPKTRKELEKNGINVTMTPSDHSSSGILKWLSNSDLKGKTIALPRTNKPSDYLRKELKKICYNVLEFPIYISALPRERSEVFRLIEDIISGDVDIITFTSSATARNLFQMADEFELFPNLREALNQRMIVVAIGPVTEKTLTESGIKVNVRPNKFTTEAMIDALQEYLKKAVD